MERPGARLAAWDDPGEVALACLLAGAGAVEVSGAAPLRALAQLKWAAARTFPGGNLRALLGLEPAGRRVYLYHYLRDRVVEGRGSPPPALDPGTRAFWDAHEALIRTGIADSGPGGRALARVRRARRWGAAVPSTGRLPLAARLALWSVAAAGPAAAAAAADLRCGLARAAGGGSAALARWALHGEPEALLAAHPALSDAGARALSASAGALLAPADPPPDASALDGAWLAPAAAAAASTLAPRLRPGAPLVIRAARAPGLPGLRLDEARTRDARAGDGSLLAAPLWVLRREG